MEWCVGSVWDLMNGEGAGSQQSVDNAEEGERPLSLQANLVPLPEPSIKLLLHSMLTGLGHLHSLNLLHRDLKSRNLLVTPESNCKLSDFGETAQLTETVTKRETFVGSPFWMAPEVISQVRRRSALLQTKMRLRATV